MSKKIGDQLKNRKHSDVGMVKNQIESLKYLYIFRGLHSLRLQQKNNKKNN